MTDNEILESMYADEVAGFTLLIDVYADFVYKIVNEVLSQVGSQKDIEDCVSDTFVAFFYNIDDVDLSRGTIKGYLGVIARRRAANLRFTLNPDDYTVFPEYTVEEMSRLLEDAEVLKSTEISDVIVRLCLKEVAPEAVKDEIPLVTEKNTEETEEEPSEDEDDIPEESEEGESEENEEDIPDDTSEETEEVITEGPEPKNDVKVRNKKRKGLGRAVKILVAMVSLVAVITAAVIAYDKLSVPKYVPPTTEPTTQSSSFNPLFSAISSGDEKLIDQLITNSLLLSQDVLKFAVEYADRISYDSIRRMAEEVRNKYGSTGLDPVLEGAIFGDFQTVKDELKNKDESEMTPSEKLALFFITTFSGEAGQ